MILVFAALVQLPVFKMCVCVYERSDVWLALTLLEND